MARYLVCLGDPVEGFTFYGPFPDHDSALEWCESEAGALDWTIATISEP